VALVDPGDAFGETAVDVEWKLHPQNQKIAVALASPWFTGQFNIIAEQNEV
jgi:hypothetical protein